MKMEVCKIIFATLCVLNLCNGQRNSYLQRGSQISSALPTTLRIGGLFDDGGDPLEEVAFKHAVERVNTNTAANLNTMLTSKIDKMPPGNSFFANETTCRLLGEGVALIIGPENPEAACHVQSICDSFEILHVETKWDFHVCRKQKMINLFPHPEVLSLAIADLANYFQWDNITILYDDGLQKVQGLLNADSAPRKKILLRKLPQGDDFRGILEQILDHDYFNTIIIDCNAYKTEVVLKQAQQIGLMNRNYKYFLTSLDIHTMNLDDYMYGKIPILAFRLVDPDSPEVKRVISDFNALAGFDRQIHQTQLQLQSQLTMSQSWKESHFSKEALQRIISTSKSVPLSIALIYDAVQLFGHVLPKLAGKVNTEAMKCDGSKWGSGHGSTIMNYMKTTPLDGLSGPIIFGKNGYRTDVKMDIVEVQRDGIKKIGVWSSGSSSRITWQKSAVDTKQSEVEHEHDDMPIHKRTFEVITIENNPFCTLKQNTTVLTGNERFEGYNVDLIEKLSSILGFKYTIRYVKDGEYGSFDATTKQWNGLIKEILDGTADIAVGDLAINEDRQRIVDLSMPHMNLGISILFVQPMNKPPRLLSFMNPFAPEVWACTLLSFFGVALTLFIVARVSPKEWDCPMPCIQNPNKLYNQFNFSNSVWFAIGSIMQQGSDLAPKVTSTRIVASMWWFFTLIMVSSYTAGLALFLMIQEKDDSIKDIKDLIGQNKVKFGCVQRGASRNFFQNAAEGTDIHKANEMMERMNPSPFVEKNLPGVKRVIEEKGKYAFFMESTLIEYNKEIRCGLEQIGGLLDNKGYGIVLKKNSTYLGDFNGAVLQLQEGGELAELKRKWWKTKINPPVCETSDSGSVPALAIANVGGVFVVMVVGCFIAIIVNIGELLWGWRRVSKLNTHIAKKSEMMKEVKFAFKCGGNVKPNLFHKPPINKESEDTGILFASKGGSTPYLDHN